MLCIMATWRGANITSTPLVPTQSIPVIANTPTPVPVLSPTAIPTPTSSPLNLHPQVVVLADNLPEPDDLVLAPDGSVYISDVTEGPSSSTRSNGGLNLYSFRVERPEGDGFCARWLH